ncbi:two-component system sensor histidine kinase NtrB [Pelotomaculum propionicicum]|uniref:two-component system sensor histidine kinase NtrB n=1 Tax=Pelotomaculum propionicicum TaxID=258475 RepID=UPI003B7C8454
MVRLIEKAEQLTIDAIIFQELAHEIEQPGERRAVDRRQSDRDVRTLNKKITYVLENITDGLFIIDKRWRFIYLNAEAEKFWSRKKGELLGKSIWDEFPEVIYSPLYKYFHRAFLNQASENFEMYCPGCNKWVEVDVNPSKEGVSFYFRDIGERKQFEKEMYRLDRLNLIGQMAAGIGHEIRNPLTTVRGFLQLLSGKDNCLQYREFFGLMIDELDRANTIITEFLSLAKDKAIELKLNNINSIIEAIKPLISSDASVSQVNINIDLAEVPDILVDEKEIRQLVLNLVRNGFEAMPTGGELSISTYADNGEIILAVKDQGNGIADDIIEKLGTPFFTTKDKGTGLGLAVCYSIAARHRAKIKVETGKTGTTFFVRFQQEN